MKSRAESITAPPGPGRSNDRGTEAGLLYVIAAPPGPEGHRASREVESSIAKHPSSGGEAPGVLWGFVPSSGAAGTGNRVSFASRGALQAALWGDPSWRDPFCGRPCDAEGVLDAWEKLGSKGTARLLDNLFAAVVIDAGAGTLHLVTDLTGGIRIFSAKVGGATVLCTSYLVAARLADAGAIDGEAIAAFFHLGYFPGRRTALAGVEVHPFASITTVEGGRLRVEPYWRPTMAIDRSRSVDESLAEGVRAFNATVREYAAGFPSMHLAMTAGLDSRTVAASLIHQDIPFTTYTHGFPGCWEEKRVSAIVRRHGIRHRFVPLSDAFARSLPDLALESFRATEGEIACIEKSHLFHVLSTLGAAGPPGAALLLGGGAGMVKGTYYRLIDDEDPWTGAGVDRYIAWNLSKKLPGIFGDAVPAGDPRLLRDFVSEALREPDGGTFFQRLDWFYLVRYRRWAGVVKNIYRRFFPVREPFVSSRMLEYLFPIDPAVKKAKLPHFAILETDYPEIRYDLTNKMTPALPLETRTAHRFAPSLVWRSKQVLRGFSRRYLPFEMFPLVDYVDYGKWTREGPARDFILDLLDPRRMRSAFLYREDELARWIERGREEGMPFAMADRMCTLELFFRAVGSA